MSEAADSLGDDWPDCSEEDVLGGVRGLLENLIGHHRKEALSTDSKLPLQLHTDAAELLTLFYELLCEESGITCQCGHKKHCHSMLIDGVDVGCSQCPCWGFKCPGRMPAPPEFYARAHAIASQLPDHWPWIAPELTRFVQAEHERGYRNGYQDAHLIPKFQELLRKRGK